MKPPSESASRRSRGQKIDLDTLYCAFVTSAHCHASAAAKKPLSFLVADEAAAVLGRFPQTFLPSLSLSPHPFVRSICSLCLVARESFILLGGRREGAAPSLAPP